MFFFLSHIDDISYKKVATQSHTYYGGAYYVANNAVDGDIATCMRTDTIGMNDLHKTVWWKVDLGGQRNIYSISILFKSYNGYGEYRLIIGVLCRLRLVLPLLSSTWYLSLEQLNHVQLHNVSAITYSIISFFFKIYNFKLNHNLVYENTVLFT